MCGSTGIILEGAKNPNFLKAWACICLYKVRYGMHVRDWKGFSPI